MMVVAQRCGDRADDWLDSCLLKMSEGQRDLWDRDEAQKQSVAAYWRYSATDDLKVSFFRFLVWLNKDRRELSGAC